MKNGKSRILARLTDTNKTWQGSVDNYRTFAADVERDVKRIRELNL
ncbi:MAG TPA: hypothetical protein VLG11_05630 [Candidatus Saccharimonadales bacterium]|nr:hypothetical protein [Candidatus Saccharimonadales bacterium]